MFKHRRPANQSRSSGGSLHIATAAGVRLLNLLAPAPGTPLILATKLATRLWKAYSPNYGADRREKWKTSAS